MTPIGSAPHPVLPAFESVPALSYGDPDAGNRLIEGDNVAVLTALAEELRGQARCIYIDPPYNTAERWTHFHDRLGHDDWLAGLESTLRALWPCLAEDGSLWISIDDGGMHYLKVLADAVVGRASFVTTIVWEHRTTRENRRASRTTTSTSWSTRRTASCSARRGTGSRRRPRS